MGFYGLDDVPVTQPIHSKHHPLTTSFLHPYLTPYGRIAAPFMLIN